MRTLSRRQFLYRSLGLGLGAAGAAALAACQPTATPQVIEKVVTQIVEKEVTKIVAGTPEVIKETVVVEVTAAPAPAQPVEITYWQAPIWRYGKDNKTPNAPIDEWINYSLELFQQANPDIKVSLELIPWDQWGAKVNTAFASGTLPNLLYSGPSIQWVQAGVLDPLDDYVTEEIRNQ
ncbi:MAG: extracellular solute-binding protein [Anaerolineae bacterium]